MILRFAFFSGGDSLDPGAWLEGVAKGRLLLPGPVERCMSLVHVDDAAAAMVAALALPAWCYNVVEDEPMTMGSTPRCWPDGWDASG